MNLRLIPILLLAAVIFTGPLEAQVTKLSNTNAFGSESAEVDFEQLRDGTDAGSVLGGWGVTFRAPGSSTPVVRTIGAASVFSNVLRNENAGESSSDIPLIVNLKHPVERIGFVLANGEEATQVTIQAWNDLGTDLGTIQENGLEESTFVGIETSDPDGISKLLISYGASANEEQINSLLIEYVERPEFVVYLAQIGDGPIPGTGNLTTSIVVSNLSASTAMATLRFFDEEGNPLSLTTGEGADDTIEMTIQPFSSRSLETDGSSDPAIAGYAVIESNVPVEGTAIFRVSSSGDIVTEAGVGSAQGLHRVVGAVQKFQAGNFDSGIAVVNTSDSNSDGRIELYDEDGNLVGSDDGLLDLAPGEHVARFLPQIFGSLGGQDFAGTLLITSDQPVATVILRTGNGLVLSSLPVGSIEE